jgi:ankyrin repeat protein
MTRKFLAVIAVCFAAASITTAADTTLLDAAESGDRAAALRLLAAKGTNVNAAGPDGATAIMYAAANDDIELVRALIKAGANVKLQNRFGT